MFAADLRLFLLVCEGPEVSDAHENYEGISVAAWLLVFQPILPATPSRKIIRRLHLVCLRQISLQV